MLKIYKSMNKELIEDKIVEIKMDLLAVSMENIRKGKDELQDASGLLRAPEDPYNVQAVTDVDHQSRVARSISILSKFIELFEGYRHDSKNSKAGATLTELADPDVKVIVQNQVSKSEGPTKFEMSLKASTTVQMIMNQAATTIYPRRDVNELSLTYKGKDLKE